MYEFKNNKKVAKNFPTHKFLGEESVAAGDVASSEVCMCVSVCACMCVGVCVCVCC